jgi:glucokinase
MRVLAGDIGGTHARLGLVDVGDGRAELIEQRTYASADYDGLQHIVETFRDELGVKFERACFGVACPVIEDDCEPTNLPWRLDVHRLGRDMGVPRTALINDFRAIGRGLEFLGPGDLVALQQGRRVEHAPIGLIGAGTGLGQGMLVWQVDHYEVLPSEGGHADFAPQDDLQRGLAAFLAPQYGHVSRERVVSGPGIVHVYRYLAAAGIASERPAVRAEMDRDDPAAVITRHALAGSDELCHRTLDLFVSAFGAQAGDLALALLARGGVYIGGGIAPRILPKLRDGAFVEAFRAKGRLSDFMTRIPVSVIINEHVGLLGAAAVAAGLP